MTTTGTPTRRGRTLDRVLAVGTVAVVAVGLLLALAVVPPEEVQGQGDAQRLMYVHVPSAWLAYLAFAVTATASALFLWPRTRSPHWDLLAGASAELGVIFTALCLVTGSLWGHPIWGTWWEWDARLTTTAILLFLYLGYLALRRVGGAREARAKRSAIAALIAFVDVPIVHFSVTWWETLHQDASVLNPELDVQLTGTMAFALVWGVVAFTLLYVDLVRRRFRLAQLEEGLEERELAAAIAQRLALEGEGALGAGEVVGV